MKLVFGNLSSNARFRYKELAIRMDMHPATLSKRMRTGYKKWTLDELAAIRYYASNIGEVFNYEMVYRKIYFETESIDELIEYIPMNFTALSLESGIELKQLYQPRLTHIDDIQKLKVVINKYTAFRVLDKYY